MELGLLWYDDSQVEFATKVQEVAQRYEEKFDTSPNRCYVNPASMPGEAKRLSLNGVKVLASTTILPDHFWVGIGSRKAGARGSGHNPLEAQKPRPLSGHASSKDATPHPRPVV